MPSALWPLTFALLALPSLVTSRECYSRNGTLITDVAYQPCSSSGESACCGTNHSGAGHTGVANDVCDANGLCQNHEGFDGTNEGVKLWWRQGCTDLTWSSPNCLASVCDTAEYEDDNAPVYDCGNGNWACGVKSYCSTSSRLFTLAATVGAEVPTSTSSTLLRSSSASTSPSESISASAIILAAMTTGTSAFWPTMVSPPASTSSDLQLSTIKGNTPVLSTAAKAGIGAGIAVFVILLGIILLLLHTVKKAKKQQLPWDKAELSDKNEHPTEKPVMMTYAREVGTVPVELPGHEIAPQEMNGQRENAELATTERAQEMGHGKERVELNASAPSLSSQNKHP
ncbi:hypothetical protein EKO04_009776 [Ascochyta lentis]|uniref:Uncharacterized protein n=1 Tax=Ascochyta lentis TaxID=205686 RepID=A0A8H7IXR0_9PLEO|nr:hypothetical protein EKO04_009776 [Ascochyta lentis]